MQQPPLPTHLFPSFEWHKAETAAILDNASSSPCAKPAKIAPSKNPQVIHVTNRHIRHLVTRAILYLWQNPPWNWHGKQQRNSNLHNEPWAPATIFSYVTKPSTVRLHVRTNVTFLPLEHCSNDPPFCAIPQYIGSHAEQRSSIRYFPFWALLVKFLPTTSLNATYWYRTTLSISLWYHDSYKAPKELQKQLISNLQLVQCTWLPLPGSLGFWIPCFPLSTTGLPRPSHSAKIRWRTLFLHTLNTRGSKLRSHFSIKPDVHSHMISSQKCTDISHNATTHKTNTFSSRKSPDGQWKN
jgi:hypothetical protein